MRIAVTGTHGSGKTTLIEDFCAAHPAYEAVPEPYWLLAQAGTPFADGPTVADLEEQRRPGFRLPGMPGNCSPLVAAWASHWLVAVSPQMGVSFRLAQCVGGFGRWTKGRTDPQRLVCTGIAGVCPGI